MHEFIMHNGIKIQTEAFMKGPSTDGHFLNISKLGDSFTTWIEVPYNIESIDANTEYIFGYEKNKFMAKQYKL